MEYLKYGDSFSLINKGDTKWKGDYLTLVKYSDQENYTFCQASAKGIKNPVDYLWAAIPAPGSAKKIGDYIESNDLLLLKNINATGIERYLTVGLQQNQASGFGFAGGVLSTYFQTIEPIAFWRLSLNYGTNNVSETPQKIPLEDKTSVFITHTPLSDVEGSESLYIVIDLDPISELQNPPDAVLVVARNLTMEWGIELSASSNNNSGPDNNGDPEGDINPRPIPGIPANTEFTITLINNESWVRSAKLNIDGNEKLLNVGPNSAISKAYKTVKGEVKVSLLDSQHGLMLIPIKIQSTNIGNKGKTVSFGAEKTKDESRPGYMDVFVHIDWDTAITL